MNQTSLASAEPSAFLLHITSHSVYKYHSKYHTLSQMYSVMACGLY